MSMIPRIIPDLYARGIQAVSKTNFAQKWVGLNAPTAIGTITTLSCATKDALNCVYYVKQSLDNKRIPEDKRNFVAGMDLVNGVLNVALQLATGLWFNSKVLPKIFENYVAPKYFSNSLEQRILALGEGKNAIKGIDADVAKHVAGKLKKAGKAGLAAAATLILTQILIKRVVVPLIATPCAAWFKEYTDKRKQTNPNIAGQDTVTFEKNPQIVSNVDHEKLPECFKNFMK